MSEVQIDDKTSSYDTLVLAGGSVRGIALLGALQYATEQFMLTKVQTYIGTSAGAMICYLLCIGYTPVEIIVYLCTHQLLEKLQNFNIVALLQGRGASSFHSLGEHLEKMTIAKLGYLPTLGDLYSTTGKTFICATHNITTSKTEYLGPKNYSKLPCITALRMSTNLPLIFEAYKYGSSFYVDGGISDNFPIQIAPPDSKVLGIMLAEGERDVETALQQNVLEYIYELMFIPIVQATQYKIDQLKDKYTLVELALSTKFKFFNFSLSSSAKLSLFSEGYEQMKNQITSR